MPKVVAGFAGGEITREASDSAAQAWIVRSAALRRYALSLLNGISIGFRSGEYGWEIAKCGATHFNRFAHARCLVCGEVVHDDGVVSLHVGVEHCSVPSRFVLEFDMAQSPAA